MRRLELVLIKGFCFLGLREGEALIFLDPSGDDVGKVFILLYAEVAEASELENREEV